MIAKLKKFDTATFSRTIEEYVRFRGLDYMDAIMLFCEENGLEIESAAAMVKRSEPIRQRLEAECIRNRTIQSSNNSSLTDFFS